jgi:uncharacterized protein involved in exopolysaccharide biosynthesis
LRPDFVITWDDFIRLKARLFQVAIVTFLLTLTFLSLCPLEYLIEATFKEGSDQSVEGLAMKELLLTGLKVGGNSLAIPILQSNQVLRPVVEKYGLQMERPRSFVSRVIDRWTAELGLYVSDRETSPFRDVCYTGDRPKKLTFHFLDPAHFQVIDQDIVAEGTLGIPVEFEGISFTCLEPVESVVLQPWPKSVKRLKKNLKIAARKGNSSIYDLTLTTEDRRLGVVLLNALMEEYRNYLKRDHDQMAREQIAYLEKKQASLSENMSSVFEEYAEYLGANHAIGLEQEARSYFDRFSELGGKILAIDVELERLEKSGDTALLTAVDKIRDLEYQKELLPRSGELVSLEFLPDYTTEMNLEAAKTLLIESSQRAHQYRMALRLLQEPAEFGPLQHLLKDTLSQSLIESATQVSLRIKDPKYCSVQDLARGKEEIALQKKLLTEHVEQLLKTEESNVEQLESAIVRGIDGEIYALHNQISRAKESRVRNLFDEKRLLQKKMEELQKKAAHLPGRWKRESWLELKSEVEKKIMTAMTELVESKTIGQHLHIVESKPLDWAVMPLEPKAPHLLLLSFAAAFSACALAFGIDRAMRLTIR